VNGVLVTGVDGACACVTCRSAEGAASGDTVNGWVVAVAVTWPAAAVAVSV
jgi:hypothetical protein